MKTNSLGTKIIASLISGLTAFVLVSSFAFAPTAYADNGTPPAGDGKSLEKAYQREQKWLSEQTDHLSKANEAAAKVQSWIDELKSKGKDTSALEAALAAFKQQIAAAQSSHDTAANILSTHAGFDANGQVTDRYLAKQTVKSAYQALSDAHKVLRQAREDLYKAIKAFREANKNKK